MAEPVAQVPHRKKVMFTTLFLNAVASTTALGAGMNFPTQGPSDDGFTPTRMGEDGYFGLACAYISGATLLLSILLEHIYIIVMLGRGVYSTERDLPGSRWRWRFQIVMPLYWVSFVIGEITLIIAIKDIYHGESGAKLCFVATVIDVFTEILTFFAHIFVVQIYLQHLVRDRTNAQISAVRESVVELAGTHVCVICTDTLPDRDMAQELSCGHSFHTSCIEQWVATNPTNPLCPLCRRVVQI